MSASSFPRIREVAVLLVGLLAAGMPVQSVVSAPGDLDPSYGQGGRVTLTLPGHANLEHAGLAVEPGDALLIGVNASWADTGKDCMVLRLGTDGAVDPTFGDQGIASVEAPYDVIYSRRLFRRPDGRIVVVGEASRPNSNWGRVAMARYEADGSPDQSFRAGGVLVSPAVSPGLVVGALLQPDGRIVVAVAGRPERELVVGLPLRLVRFDEDGQLDTSFGSGGFLTLDGMRVGSSLSREAGWNKHVPMAMQADGKLIVASWAPRDMDPSSPIRWNDQLAVARLTPDGLLDATFDDDGLFKIDLEESGSSASAIAALPDGRTLVSAYIQCSYLGADQPLPHSCAGATRVVVVRLEADGRIDLDFGSAGRLDLDAQIQPSGTIYLDRTADSLLVLESGEFLLAGRGLHRDGDPLGPSDLYVSRFTLAGQVDESFGAGGSSFPDFGHLGTWGSGVDRTGAVLELQSTGAPLVATTHPSTASENGFLTVARLLPAAAEPGLIAFADSRVVVSEGAGAVRLRVLRIGGSSGAIGVDFSTIDRTAVAGADFGSSAGSLDWADGDESERTIDVPITNDALVEDVERFTLRLRHLRGNAGIGTRRATVTIRDDDQVPAP